MKSFLNLSFVGFALVVLAIACGKKDDGGSSGGGNSVPYVNPYNNGCTQAGYVYTQYGCMPTAGCPSGQGMYNGSCYPATNGGGAGTCTTPSCLGGSQNNPCYPYIDLGNGQCFNQCYPYPGSVPGSDGYCYYQNGSGYGAHAGISIRFGF